MCGPARKPSARSTASGRGASPTSIPTMIRARNRNSGQMSELTYSSDVAFTPTVKAVQARKGSRRAYSAMEQKGSWQTRITADLADFIAPQTSVFLATTNLAGQPYIQHRGGPAGFFAVVDGRAPAL